MCREKKNKTKKNSAKRQRMARVGPVSSITKHERDACRWKIEITVRKHTLCDQSCCWPRLGRCHITGSSRSATKHCWARENRMWLAMPTTTGDKNTPNASLEIVSCSFEVDEIMSDGRSCINLTTCVSSRILFVCFDSAKLFFVLYARQTLARRPPVCRR